MKVRYVGTAGRRTVIFEDGRTESVKREDPEHGGKGTVLEVDEAIGETMCKNERLWKKDSGGGAGKPSAATKAPSGGKE